jgi:hypothetical protein
MDTVFPKNVTVDKATGRHRAYASITVRGTRFRKTRLLPMRVTPDAARKYLEDLQTSLRAQVFLLAGNDRSIAEPGWLTEVRGELKDWRVEIETAKADVDSWFHVILKNIKQRCARRKMGHALSADQLLEICKRSRGRCEVTGIRFSFVKVQGSRMRPFAPSIDRREAGGAYSSENSRLVCAAVNVAMFNWGDELFKTIAVGYVSHLLKSL